MEQLWFHSDGSFTILQQHVTLSCWLKRNDEKHVSSPSYKSFDQLFSSINANFRYFIATQSFTVNLKNTLNLYTSLLTYINVNKIYLYDAYLYVCVHICVCVCKLKDFFGLIVLEDRVFHEWKQECEVAENRNSNGQEKMSSFQLHGTYFFQQTSHRCSGDPVLKEMHLSGNISP